ncbi:MAG: Gldg family protein, partial [Candidatus Hydrogenedentes bacterium]|nr:Gldg family protein [Candidatus Hydrogenedentota bacterium]
MRNVRTILRRDLGAYFTSPIGYIFIMVFITISVGLYITSFFTFPVADMRSYFGNLPLLMCVFIPAVTMRVWAEERKENTWEMLLTFPMKSWELVIGKFLATFIFFLITLAGTLTVPIMLAVLGNPDPGAIFGGYLGTILLGAFFLSIGIFFSGFCRDQIVAFVITLLACFLVFLLGTDFIASYIDGYAPGLGTLLGSLLGMLDHYGTFIRGVLELTDVVYFVAWTVLFLVLNILFIEGRNRPGSRLTFATAVTLCFGIGLAFNWLVSDLSILRRDLTEDKIYTVSPATEKILSGLDAPVNVKVYITPESEMPTAVKNLEQDITDKLDEMRVASGGKLTFTPVYLKAANVLASQEDLFSAESEEDEEGETTEAEAIEKRMLEKGVQPFMVQAQVEDEFTQKPIYSSIGISYRENKEEILPQVAPDEMRPATPLSELEYRLVNTVYKLSRDEAPKVALVAPMESVNIPPQMRQIYMQLGQPIPEQDDPYEYLQAVLEIEKYEVERVQLTQD